MINNCSIDFELKLKLEQRDWLFGSLKMKKIGPIAQKLTCEVMTQREAFLAFTDIWSKTTNQER